MTFAAFAFIIIYQRFLPLVFVPVKEGNEKGILERQLVAERAESGGHGHGLAGAGQGEVCRLDTALAAREERMESPAFRFREISRKEVLVEGRRVIVSMGKQGAGGRAVRRDTCRARVVNTLAVGAAHEERRFDDDLDGFLVGAAAMRARLDDFMAANGDGSFSRRN